MGPGLVPGDFVATGWLPDRDRWRSPRRFDRWIARLPDGSTGLKRIAGLPGETVGIVNGDLEINGALTVKNPWQSATLGSVVSREQPEDTSRWSRPSKVVLDRAPVAATMVNLRLLPVCDVGFAATIRLTEPAAGGCRARAVAGPLAVTWRLSTAGRLAIVAGRLDGQAVAAAWPLPAAGDLWLNGRRCLPGRPPDRWDLHRPWPTSPASADPAAPALSLTLAAGPDATAAIEEVVVWRDVRYRPAADGRDRWRLADGEFLLLGDFPPGSRDSRHFGPLPRTALRHRIEHR